MISQKEYTKRRKKFAKKLEDNSVAVLYSAKYKTRSNDTEYPFRQESNFYYLSGFREDNAALVFVKSKGSAKTILFVQKKDETLELWSGKRVGEIQAKTIFDVDEVYTSDMFEQKILELLKGKNMLYFDFASKDERINNLKDKAKAIVSHKDIMSLIGYMRLIKSPSEIMMIQDALEITKKAHHEVMKLKKTGKKEYELQAEIEYIFKKNGAYSDAYTSIVACANAANTLHYIENVASLVEGELILIDAGCELEYYASDITRTIPVNGKFSQAQKELYEMVLDVECEVIKMVKPGVKRSALQAKAVKLLCKGMLKLGILKGSLENNIKKEKYKKYYPHGIGHWMGLDVHDQCPYKYENGDEIPLMSGMVLTIEPGIYIDKDDKKVPKKYRGIGIRIEDDILVTKDGHQNLSQGIVKSVKEIQRLKLSNNS
ncbi:MAG TPA: xaa-pro aminopeptidase [Sulfurimonas sp. UBA12504]|nr:MAG: xaa-pro aminopeptidase [Sulfurimonas sp. GWF2_37_8]DAB31129.1 MAG TPA: xaa-pro aminopeptidase [Sulfurimonas sp. UBA12504]